MAATTMARAKLTLFSILSRTSSSSLLIRNSPVSRSFCLCSSYFFSEKNAPDIAKMTNATIEEEEQGPRNLFEVFASNENLLAPKKSEVRLMSSEEIKFEVEKQTRLKRRKMCEIDPSKETWSPRSRRVGAIGVKLGMSALWKKDGRRVPVTLVQIKECEVVQVQTTKFHGGVDQKTMLVVGAVNDYDLHEMDKSRYGHFKKCGVLPKKKIFSFRVTKNALLNPGTPIYAGHFYPGQFVKIQGVTKDRGFQGVMKRWGMKGQPKTHGQTKTHRKMGATGGGTRPGRIWPGKRMPGHMGLKNCTQILKVHRINTKYNVLYVHGQLPGPKGGFLRICDAWKKHPITPPFPTYFPDDENPLEEDLYDENIQPFHADSIVYEEKKMTKGR